tara:strand:- start:4178 stop:4354 length:177 start_codon:yes stop_codon:yes gene_type:complete
MSKRENKTLDLYEILIKNKSKYMGVSREHTRSSSWLLRRIGEKTYMPTFIEKKGVNND